MRASAVEQDVLTDKNLRGLSFGMVSRLVKKSCIAIRAGLRAALARFTSGNFWEGNEYEGFGSIWEGRMRGETCVAIRMVCTRRLL